MSERGNSPPFSHIAIGSRTLSPRKVTTRYNVRENSSFVQRLVLRIQILCKCDAAPELHRKQGGALSAKAVDWTIVESQSATIEGAMG